MLLRLARVVIDSNRLGNPEKAFRRHSREITLSKRTEQSDSRGKLSFTEAVKFFGWPERCVIVLGVVFIASAFCNPLWMLSAELAFSASSKISIGLTLLAISIAIAIFRLQEKASEDTEGRLHSKIGDGFSAIAAIFRAYSEKDLALPSEHASLSYQRSVSQFIATNHRSEVKVLWVDDNVAWIRREKSILEGLGVMVIWVPSTGAAMEVLAHLEVNLVISDMARGVERLAGLELLDRIRRGERGVFPEVPFIVYSSSATRLERESVRKHGGQDQIADPIELVESALELMA